MFFPWWRGADWDDATPPDDPPETDPDQAEAERITDIQPSGDRSGATDSANVQAAADALPSGPVIYVDTSSDPDQAEAERIAEVFDQARTDTDQEHRP
jgi:hypothetical protein